MSAKNRSNLYALFKNGCIPTATDFQCLIDSVLVKRNDQFFGKWQTGERYCNGDVVLYGKSLYMLNLPEAEDCEEKDETDKTDNCICSTTPPSPDSANWCTLQLQMEDDDWEVLPPEEGRAHSIMYAKVFGRIGVGTQNPETRFDLFAANKGQFLLDPDGKNEPTSIIRNLNDAADANYLWNRLGDSASWITDAPLGYTFKVFNEMSGDKMPTEESETHLLMLISSDDDKNPCVGIGTATPQATLDIKQEGKGQVLIKTSAIEGPEILMVALDTKEDPAFCALSVDDAWMALTTDAAKGFQFRRSEAYSSHEKGDRNAGEALVTITARGQVGIGTDIPHGAFQVTDGSSGSFSMNLDHPAPAFSILNLKPNETKNYLTIGVDNDQAVLLTDAESGFVFKRGKNAEEGNEELLDQGEDLLRIQKDGKVGIGKRPHEKDYQVDINGDTRSFGIYQAADTDNISEQGYLKYPTEDIMEELCSLNAYLFNWDLTKTQCADKEQQIGLRASEVEECFRQVVKGKPGNKAIAYQNLVPVLIEAIKQLHARVLVLEGKENS